jgi:hypothetical protein
MNHLIDGFNITGPDIGSSYTEEDQYNAYYNFIEQNTDQSLHIHWTGVGSQKTPPQVGQVMTRLSAYFETLRFVLRTGGASGADTYFYNGLNRKNDNTLQMFHPWKGFSSSGSDDHYRAHYPQNKAFEMMEEIHPKPRLLTQAGRKLHARNIHQVLGPDLDHPIKSAFLVCWTPGGGGCRGNKDRNRARKTI